MATYSFNGEADNTDLGSVSGWTRYSGSSGDIRVMADGKVDFVNTGDSAYGVSAGSADHSFEITYGTPNNYAFFPCCVRLTDSNNFIGARYFSGEVQLYKRVGGTFTLLDSAAQSAANGDKLKVTASGNTLNVYWNGSLKIGPITESAHSSVAVAGIVGRSETATDVIDAAEVINLAAASGLSITSVTPTDVYSKQVDVVVAGTKLSNTAVVTFAGAACTGLSASGSTSLKITMPDFYTNNIKVGTVKELKIIG